MIHRDNGALPQTQPEEGLIMDSSSRSKPIVDRRHVSRPDVPILETGDLPADDDWALMKSFDVEQDDIDNTELDTGQITISSGAFD